MTEGTVTRWLVKPGDLVNRGDIVAEVETDKADMEVECFESGTVAELVVPQGETVAVGTVLAIIATGTEAAEPAPEAPAVPSAAPGPTAAEAVLVGPRATPTARVLARQLAVDLASVLGTGLEGAITRADVEHAASRRAPVSSERPRPGRPLLVSPRARRLAAERGIDLALVSGSGPGGSITAADIDRRNVPAPTSEAAPEAPAPRAAAPEQKRKTIATLMERSNREIPHYYLGSDINLQPALDWLAAENKRRSVNDRLLYSALLMKATALAAHDVPEMNGYFTDGEFRPSSVVNLGVAVSLRTGGLVAPAILDASNKPLGELMQNLMDLVKRSRSGKLRASEMSSGTITVTNLGDLGVDYVQGIIYPPQVALVGFGRVQQRPWAKEGMLGVKPVITATLAADHRASDGHRGGVFLTVIARLLEDPGHL